MQNTRRVTKGFTLIELMIVVAIIAVLVSLALPTYRDYTIRTKVSEGLSVAAAAKLAISETCQSDPTMVIASAADAGYNFAPSTYVSDIIVGAIGGSCGSGLGVGIATANTGAATDIVLVLLGDFGPGNGRISWDCYFFTGEARHVPAECRTPWVP